MAYLGDIQTAGTPQTIQQVMEYIHMLEERLRFVLGNISNENIQNGSIAEKKLEEPLVRGLKKTEDTAEGLAKLERRLTEAIKADREKMAAAGMGTEGIDLDAATAETPIYSDKATLDKNGLTIKAGGALKVYDASSQQLVDVADGWVKNAEIVEGALVLTLSNGDTVTYGGT